MNAHNTNKTDGYFINKTIKGLYSIFKGPGDANGPIIDGKAINTVS